MYQLLQNSLQVENLIMLIYGAAFLISLLGSTLHWVKRYTREQTSRNFLQYLKDFKLYTIASLGAVITSVAATLGSMGDVDLSSPLLISLLLSNGYTIDSVINKDEDS